jgi:LysM repeat protein
MKRILFSILFASSTVTAVFAQDAGTQQQIDKLSGQIQDLLDAQAQQGKRLDALEKEISDLTDKVNSPAVNNSASADDLKTLAAQVQEIDKKRQDDNELILKQLDKLAKLSGSPTGHKSKPVVDTTATTSNGDDSTTPAVPQKGYDYTIEPGDTISAIVKAYRARGVQVTTTQIIAANPKINPNALIVGKKIFIPDANAK